MKFKQIRFFATSILFFALIFMSQSCKKCNTCVAKDQDGIERYTYPEVCGSKKDLAEYADQCATQYGAYGHTCVCSEIK